MGPLKHIHTNRWYFILSRCFCVIPFSVMDTPMAATCPGNMNDCLITIGGGGGLNELNVVALLCCFPSNNSKTPISVLLFFWFQ